MTSTRLEAFSDAVIAILITIMVLELRPPEGAEFDDLRVVAPHALAFVLSFIFVAIYWSNHHHLLQAIERVDGAVLWANLHLMFWLSLVPAGAAWLGEHPSHTAPAVVYGVILLGAAVAYFILTRSLLRCNGDDSHLAQALGSDRKGKISPVFYVAGVVSAFFAPWLAITLYVVVAGLWLVPDRRMERALSPTLGAN